MLDTSILILRLLLALILLAHASQKLFGWFGGNGLKKQASIFESLGLRPGRVMVSMAVTMEVAAAALFALGLSVPLAATIGAGTMLVAGLTMHMSARTMWNSAGGGEYPYVLAVIAVAIGIAGGGSYSIDTILVAEWPSLSAFLIPSMFHVFVIPAIAVISAVPFALRLRLEQRQAKKAPTEQNAR